ncbi:hypothetical protein DMH04_56625 [Kibdelosporangium aridum]|uniref:Uncharacterized protein n=1 Tax=Kibdelosporangium aridum TaxID=2030 RepID=A0A428XQR7_KIBAR|nr:hypothetical protein [Kibdelosporangium aridum]RSM57658.1 hypothetical protein DMH04_56625 [Kibdelosporangium aridum]
MPSSDDLLNILRRSDRAGELLAAIFKFDVTRGETTENAVLASGQPLEPVAGDFSGGTFYLCGDTAVERPVLYASSEGQAGLIGDSLDATLALIIGLPYWEDCLGYSGGGDLAAMTSAAEYLRRDTVARVPEISAHQAEAADLLSLDIPSPETLLVQLHSVVSRSAPDYVFSDDSGEYEGLFGPWRPDRNPRWR